MSNECFDPFMREALELAERGRWHTAPNPTVGAVLVRDGHVVARGWHERYGSAHAEVRCLQDAVANGIDPATCTLVVTLEPCHHHGKTPPCTEAILKTGIRHVVLGTLDPTTEAGGGAAFLRSQGIRVDTGVEEQACRDAIADFLVWQQTERPYVILKLASTLDGRIAARSGHPQWISCAATLRHVHELRCGIGFAGGAVMVGSNTLTADNPRLSARLHDDALAERQPLAVVLASRLPMSDNLHLTSERVRETVYFTTASGAATPRAAVLRERGASVIGLDDWKSPTGKDISTALRWLRTEKQCRYVLCEGGGKLGLSLLEAGFVDELRLHFSPLVLGDAEARALFSGRSPLGLEEALRLRLVNTRLCGEDCLLTLRPLSIQ